MKKMRNKNKKEKSFEVASSVKIILSIHINKRHPILDYRGRDIFVNLDYKIELQKNVVYFH